SLLTYSSINPGGDFGVGWIEEGNCTWLSPFRFQSITLNAYEIRQLCVVLVAGNVNIKCHSKITLNGRKQPIRCSPEVTKRVVALSLFDFFGCNHLLSR